MFIIPNSRPPAEDKQIRLLIIGVPGSGKTTSSLTFPNPICANTDRGLLGHRHRTDIQEVPFYDEEWLRKNFPSETPASAYLSFIKKHRKNLTPDQTLITDSLTTLQDYFHSAKEPQTPTSKGGELDKRWIWSEKLKYMRDVHLALGELKCNIVSIIHEVPERNSEGVIIGYRNALTGAFGDSLGRCYTDLFRQIVVVTDKNEGGKLIKSYEYKFQIKPDATYKIIKTRQQTTQQFIPATYEAIKELYKL